MVPEGDNPSSKGTKSVEFVTAESSGSGNPEKRRSSAGKRRSSLFRALDQSFRRSGGERGASVDSLRGTQGPDFEAEAIISRAGSSGCGCFGGGGSGKGRTHLLLIKGPFVFVFVNESDTAPKYAISLSHMKATVQGSNQHSYPVSLETHLGDIEYELFFSKESDAKEFVEVATKQAAVGETELIRKRLGHESLLSKRSSLQYAENIALKKIDAQPEKREPLSADEMIKVSEGNTGFPM